MSEIPIKDAKNRAHDLLERLNASLDSGEISENDWYGELNGVITRAYLSNDHSKRRNLMARKLNPLTIFLTLMFTTLPALGELVKNTPTPPQLVLILDASGSMWGQVEGEYKIEVARRVLKQLIEGLPDEARIGLVAYGHRKPTDCDDIETLVPLGPLDKAAISEQVDALNPRGRTPITGAITKTFEEVRSVDGATTIIVLTDGLETCGGDPCQVVQDAKTAGLNFVMHVIGFDVAKDKVSQLECTAQAGDGLYVSAGNADELAEALNQTVEAAGESLTSKLSVKVLAEGELIDAIVSVRSAGSPANAKNLAGGRTYAGSETNPRIMPLPVGTYDVTVKAIGFRGDVQMEFKDVEVVEGETVEKVADFSVGEVAVKVTRNGVLSDATVAIRVPGSRRHVAGGRSYKSASTNPAIYRITPGTYEVYIRSIEIRGPPEKLFQGVVVEGNGRVELAHDFSSGTLRIGVVNAGALVDAVVSIISVETGKSVAGGRTYTNPRSNPKAYEVLPGRYRVKVKPVKLRDKPPKEFEIAIEATETVERIVDLAE